MRVFADVVGVEEPLSWFDRQFLETGPTTLVLFGFIVAEIAFPFTVIGLVRCRNSKARWNVRFVLFASILRLTMFWGGVFGLFR